MHTSATTLISSLVLLLGCSAGADGGADGGAACPDEGRYFELRPGASWTYRTVDDSVSSKVQTVGELEDVGGSKAGVMAYRMTTLKAGGGMTVSWQEDTGEAIRRHREVDPVGTNTSDDSYEPYRTRMDGSAAHTALGASWEEHYTAIVSENGGEPTTVDRIDRWSVVAVDEVITVPAGEFCTLRLRRLGTIGDRDGPDKSYWFARGVGKVQEIGPNQTESLVSYVD